MRKAEHVRNSGKIIRASLFKRPYDLLVGHGE
jgi:hypothetical protein